MEVKHVWICMRFFRKFLHLGSHAGCTQVQAGKANVFNGRNRPSFDQNPQITQLVSANVFEADVPDCPEIGRHISIRPIAFPIFTSQLRQHNTQ